MANTLATSDLPDADISVAIRRIFDAVGFDFLTQNGPAFVADPAGRVIWANAAWAEFTIRLGRVADDTPVELPWPPDGIIAAVRANGGAPIAREDAIEMAGGTDLVRSQHWVGFAADGTVLGIAGSVDEASLGGRLRHQLSALQDRLDDVIRLVSDWLWETGPDLVLGFVSGRVGEALGYHPRELIGHKLLEFGNFIDASGDPETSPFDSGRPRPFRDRAFAMRNTNGATRQFRLSGLPVFDPETGRFRGYRGTARDVTAEATALGLLRASRRQLNHAIEAVPDGFALFDAEERLLLSNQRFVDMLPLSGDGVRTGVDHREMMQAAVAAGDILPSEGADRLLAESLMERARNFATIEYELADGRWVRATERETPEGTIVGIRTDITEMKHREQALIDAKMAAEYANRAKSEFLANISHELRTPLNAIIGFSELIVSEAMGPIGNPQYRDYLNDVLDSGRHLLGIINDVIELAKAESGRLELIEDFTEVDGAIEGVLRLMRERALHGDVRLESRLDPDLPSVRADPRKLGQILLNLVSNAVKFTPPGGIVTVDAKCDVAGDLVLSVIDTGIGIAPDDIATAFKPFGQVDATLSRKYPGTGLGLPLARAMVELHDGSIEIDSTVGSGSTVIVRLPASRLERPG